MKHCRHGLMIALLLLAMAPAQAMASALADTVPGAGPFEGYTLVAPMRSHTTYLLDLEGRCVHKWESDYPPGLGAYLLENGHLLRTARRESAPEDQAASGTEAFEGASQGGRVQEFTWDGELVWDFEYASDRYMRHHDVTPMPNGNVLLIAWEHKTAEEAVAAGRDPQKLGAGELWPDHIVEIQPEGPTGGRIVWEWHVWDHLVQDFDPAKANYGVVGDHPELVDINWVDTTPKDLHTRPAADNAEEREKLAALGYMPAAPATATPAEGKARNDHFEAADFNHTNSVAYNAALDQIALSVLKFNEVWIIDHGTTTAEAAGHAGGRSGRGGDLLYRWGNPQAYRAGTAADQKLFGQHDARWVEPGRPGAGNLLVFNNGRGRADGDYSTVEEITPPLTNAGGYARTPGRPFGPDEVAWRYEAPERHRFFSKVISGAQRQPNGNTLICEGTRGRLFEVTPAGETVWQYQHKADCDQGCQKGIFKVRRYAQDFPGVAGHALTSEPMPEGSTALPAEPVIPTAPTPEQLARALNPPSGEKAGCPVIYVNRAATGTGDGLSWANACTTIAAGIAAAATCGSDVWIAQGTYAESITLASNVALYGGFAGTETALNQRNIAAHETILDGYGYQHAVVMQNVVNTRLDGLTITRGGQGVGDNGADGGGIYCANANSTNVVVACVIKDNQANSIPGECNYCHYINSWTVDCGSCPTPHSGGGIYCANALPIITGCTISGNVATESGGGVYGGSVVNCTFTGNSASSGGGMDDGTATNCNFAGNNASSGGGMHDGTAANCTFTGNSANVGGGMSGGAATNGTFTGNTAWTGGGMYGGTATNCTFTGNNATYEGGGMRGGAATNCTFTGNTANHDGGGMDEGTATNCTFTGNTANNVGGGMFDGTAANCTFTANTADYGGGMYDGTAIHCTFTGNTANVNSEGGGMDYGTAVNCILWGNGPEETYGTTVTWSCLSVPTTGEGNIAANPKFVNPWAGDFRLQADSPCVDTGTTSGAPSTDILGRTRPQGAGVDMGAYEFYAGDDTNAVNTPPILRVNAASTSTAPDGLTWETAFPTLQQAADHGGYGAKIWVAAGTYTANTGDEVMRLKPSTSVYGGFIGTETDREQRDWATNKTIIDGQNARRCVTATVTTDGVDGFTLQQGKAAAGGGMNGGTAANCTFTGNSATYYGGGMYYGTTTNCTFTGNAANDYGGGMYHGTATNCTFTGNTATSYGGGMFYGTATNCTFTGNTASAGGGVYGSAATNCTFTGNTASAGGGGMDYGTATNCTFIGNTADYGGGMYDGTVRNCILWGNGPNETSETTVTYSCLSVSTAGEGNIADYPQFVNPWEGDFRLRAGSPCVDTGTTSGAPSVPNADMLGRTRPQGPGVDMGAYEYYPGDDAGAVDPPVFRVKAGSTASEPDGLTWETAFPALQQAADHTGFGAEIWVAQGVYSAPVTTAVTNLKAAGQVYTAVASLKAVSRLYGGFAGTETDREERNWTAYPTIIDAEGVGRCVNSNSMSVVEGFTLRNGSADVGGGVLGGNVANCIFTGNTASEKGGGFANGTATNCVFTGNTAPTGGGMSDGVAINCTLTGNTASTAGGAMAGGIAVNSILWGNGTNGTNGTDGTNVMYSCLSAATVGDGNIVADPLFADAGAVNFQLQAGSPCVDAGTSEFAPATDILGIARPQHDQYDMGAYESTLPLPEGEVEGEGEGEGEPVLEGEPPAEGEGEVTTEGEGEVMQEGEGEVLSEGEGEVLPEGEGEVTPEGEGEVTHEGEGEMLAEGEGEVMPEGEAEGEPAPDLTVAAQALLDNLDIADASGDGALSFEEAAGQVAGLTQAQFTELDGNGDGQLSQEELEDYLGVGGCRGCRGCHKTKAPLDRFKNGLGDLFLVGLSLTLLLAAARQRV